jgi:hypothetical protein
MEPPVARRAAAAHLSKVPEKSRSDVKADGNPKRAKDSDVLHLL